MHSAANGTIIALSDLHRPLIQVSIIFASSIMMYYCYYYHYYLLLVHGKDLKSKNWNFKLN